LWRGDKVAANRAAMIAVAIAAQGVTLALARLGCHLRFGKLHATSGVIAKPWCVQHVMHPLTEWYPTTLLLDLST
jgi:hypothetical protein